jgi:CPA2 family monovalent cation:H+ antiporter-2
MAAGTEQDYSNLVAFLATAGIVAPLVKRLKLSPILGFLAAGVVIGPEGLGRFAGRRPWLNYLTVAKPHEIAAAAELGVVFLLFSIGLELSWERLRLMRKQVFGLGALQTVGAGALLAGAALALGLTANGAIAAAAALVMASTALVVPVMAERGRLNAAPGRAVFAILLFQDLMVAPVLIGLSLLGGQGPSPLGAALSACAGVVGILAVGRLALRPLFRSAARAT